MAFDNGGSTTPGNPVGTFEKAYSSFPVPGTTAQAWYFGPGGTLTSGKPTAATGHDHYVSDPTVRPRADFGGSTSDIWVAAPEWNWTQLVGGNALAYTSKPLSSNEVMAGFGSVDLWLTSSATDTDLQVTLTEIRPDGKEEYVQSGWLRASDRKLDPASTVLDPISTGLASDVKLLTPGKASLARVELYPFAHAFRKGSRIRIVGVGSRRRPAVLDLHQPAGQPAQLPRPHRGAPVTGGAAPGRHQRPDAAAHLHPARRALPRRRWPSPTPAERTSGSQKIGQAVRTVWHCLALRPLPQGHGSLRPAWARTVMTSSA